MFLKAEPLTSAAFLAYGEVIECPAIPGRTYFEDALANLRPNARPSISLTVKHAVAEMPLRSTTMERHEFSSQSFIPQEAGRWLVIVAPHDKDGGPDMARARAFLAGPMQGVTFGANVWHHPFTILDGPARFVIVMWRDGSRTDEEFVEVARVQRGAALMSYEVKRDFIGYGANPPDPQWPNGAKHRGQFRHQLRGGLGALDRADGDGYTENGLTESRGLNQLKSGRDLAAEGMFEYGSRVGFWRLTRLFAERGLPLTIFGCALALERNPEAAAAIRAAGYDVCCHGWRWVKHFELSEAEEREHIARAVASLEKTIGQRRTAGTAATDPA